MQMDPTRIPIAHALLLLFVLVEYTIIAAEPLAPSTLSAPRSGVADAALAELERRIRDAVEREDFLAAHDSQQQVKLLRSVIATELSQCPFSTMPAVKISPELALPRTWHEDASGWRRDPHEETALRGLGDGRGGLRCDIERRNASADATRRLTTREFDATYRGQRPVLISGLTEGWGAVSGAWRRDIFLGAYGDRHVRVGPSGELAANGAPSTSAALGALLDGGGGGCGGDDGTIGQAGSNGPVHGFDCTAFDSSFLANVPELGADFDLDAHPILSLENGVRIGSKRAGKRALDGRAGHPPERVRTVLSVGRARSGVGFHTHGEGWLALVHGAKRWAVYPPGSGPPATLANALHPLREAQAWLEEVYPNLPPAGSPEAGAPSDGWRSRIDGGAGVQRRPTECVQLPGEVGD